MFDWIETENLDPRLITVNSGGKISTEYFPTVSLLGKVRTAEDFTQAALGNVRFLSNSSDLQISSTGQIVQFASNFRPSTLDYIWADNFYLTNNITLSSDKNFSISSSDSTVTFGPNALHSVNGLRGDLDIFGVGNLSISADRAANKVAILLEKIDSSNIDESSSLTTRYFRSTEGVRVDSALYPDFPSIIQSGNVTYLQGITGVSISSPNLSEMRQSALNFPDSSLLDNQGQIVFSSSGVSFPTGTHLYGAQLPAVLEYSLSNYVLTSGTYSVSITHNKGQSPLFLAVDFDGSQIGLGKPFSSVLSAIQETQVQTQIPAYNQSLQDLFLLIMPNPDGLSGSTLTDYTEFVSDLMGDFLALEPASTPMDSLVNAINALVDPVKKAKYLSLLSILTPSTLGNLESVVTVKLDIYEASDTLLLPKSLAYYYQFTENTFSLFLKSPTVTPPTATVKILFASS